MKKYESYAYYLSRDMKILKYQSHGNTMLSQCAVIFILQCQLNVQVFSVDSWFGFMTVLMMNITI